MELKSKKLLFTALMLVGVAAWAGSSAWYEGEFFGGENQSATAGAVAFGDDSSWDAPSAASRTRTSMIVDLPVSTQGPLWPPSEVVDKNGEFLLIGNALKEVQPGVIGMVPNTAAIVSKNTVPPLDANGIEDSSNWFGAPHKIIRNLDLRKGSPDLNIELFSSSFGPHDDGITSSPRIPRAGETQYNLNKGLTICADAFPTAAQKMNYFRPSYPLNKVPVLGFQGDGVAYDPATGNAYDPKTASNDPSCAATGCPGEDPVDTRSTKPITLGDWVKSEGKVKIQLTRPNAQKKYTAATFDFKIRNMLPNAVYTVWVVRGRVLPFPGRNPRVINPIATPNVLVTDAQGRATAQFEVGNPFPDSATDSRGMRIIALSMVYHSDKQNWGACFARFGAGVDVHVVFNTMNTQPKVPGTLPDMTDFVTVAQ